jgi:hypothetical protein
VVEAKRLTSLGFFESRPVVGWEAANILEYRYAKDVDSRMKERHMRETKNRHLDLAMSEGVPQIEDEDADNDFSNTKPSSCGGSGDGARAAPEDIPPLKKARKQKEEEPENFPKLGQKLVGKITTKLGALSAAAITSHAQMLPDITSAQGELNSLLKVWGKRSSADFNWPDWISQAESMILVSAITLKGCKAAPKP